MSPGTGKALDLVWEFIAFLLTAFAFLLVGASITVGELVAALPWIAWGVVAILFGRAVVIYGLLGGVSRLAARGGAGQAGFRRPAVQAVFGEGRCARPGADGPVAA